MERHLNAAYTLLEKETSRDTNVPNNSVPRNIVNNEVATLLLKLQKDADTCAHLDLPVASTAINQVCVCITTQYVCMYNGTICVSITTQYVYV